MNKLQGSIVYLAGPIDHATDYGIGWRKEITPKLHSLGMLVIDPTNKPVLYNDLNESAEIIAHRKALKSLGKYEAIHDLMKPIRAFDLRGTDKADCIIAYLDYDVVMTGTMEEIFISNKDKKPVLIFCKQGRKAVSDWLYGAIHPKYIFENMEDLLEYLNKVNNGEEIDNSRWHFFNWPKMIEDQQKSIRCGGFP
jgi:nucleoside 2-deoxyribosyltransferase